MQPIVKTERYIPIKVYKRENYWYGKWTVSEPTPRNKTEADKGLKPTSNIPEVFATHRGSFSVRVEIIHQQAWPRTFST